MEATLFDKGLKSVKDVLCMHVHGNPPPSYNMKRHLTCHMRSHCTKKLKKKR